MLAPGSITDSACICNVLPMCSRGKLVPPPPPDPNHHHTLPHSPVVVVDLLAEFLNGDTLHTAANQQNKQSVSVWCVALCVSLRHAMSCVMASVMASSHMQGLRKNNFSSFLCCSRCRVRLSLPGPPVMPHEHAEIPCRLLRLNPVKWPAFRATSR